MAGAVATAAHALWASIGALCVVCSRAQAQLGECASSTRGQEAAQRMNVARRRFGASSSSVGVPASVAVGRRRRPLVVAGGQLLAVVAGLSVAVAAGAGNGCCRVATAS